MGSALPALLSVDNGAGQRLLDNNNDGGLHQSPRGRAAPAPPSPSLLLHVDGQSSDVVSSRCVQFASSAVCSVDQQLPHFPTPPLLHGSIACAPPQRALLPTDELRCHPVRAPGAPPIPSRSIELGSAFVRLCGIRRVPSHLQLSSPIRVVGMLRLMQSPPLSQPRDTTTAGTRRITDKISSASARLASPASDFGRRCPFPPCSGDMGGDSHLCPPPPIMLGYRGPAEQLGGWVKFTN